MLSTKITKNIIFRGGDIIVNYCSSNDLLCQQDDLASKIIAKEDKPENDYKINSELFDLLALSGNQKFTLLCQLSKNASSESYLCLIEGFDILHIIKIPVYGKNIDSTVYRNKLFNEISFQIKASTINISPKIISLFKFEPVSSESNNIFDVSKHVYIMDYAGELTLSDHLKINSDASQSGASGSAYAERDVNNKVILDFINKCTEAINILHDNHIKHNDFHTKNILIDNYNQSDWKCNVINYDLSFQYDIRKIDKNKCKINIYDRYNGKIADSEFENQADSSYIINNYYADQNIFKISDLLLCYISITKNIIDNVSDKKEIDKFVSNMTNIINKNIQLDRLFKIDFKFTNELLYKICEYNNLPSIYITLILMLTKIYKQDIFNKIIKIYTKIYPNIKYDNIEIIDITNKLININNLLDLFYLLVTLTSKSNIILKNIYVQHEKQYIKNIIISNEGDIMRNILSFIETISNEDDSINDNHLQKFLE